jgi:hypothetical protein
MQQFAQNFYSSVLLHKSDDSASNRDYSWGGKDGRHAILRSFINGREPALSGLHVCSSISTPVVGGGVVAYYRLLDLPNESGEKDYVYCKNEKGWSKADVRDLLNYELREYDADKARPLVRANSSHDNAQTTWYKSRDVKDSANASAKTVGKFNAIFLRPPGPGWMKLHEITRERLLESIRLLHELFGVETVILSTMMFNNNVLTPNDWKDMLTINEMIRDLAHNWDSHESGVKFILVQDLAAFTNEILWMNAQHLGYNVSYGMTQQLNESFHSVWKREGAKFLLHRLYMKDWKFNPSVSMVCNTSPICEHNIITTLPNDTTFTNDNLCVMNITADPAQCFFNRFSRDGMHWCMETIGPRYSASVACLLGCVYNGNADKEFETSTESQQQMMDSIRQCEMECNGQYMSLAPVDERWLDNETTLYSRFYQKYLFCIVHRKPHGGLVLP